MQTRPFNQADRQLKEAILSQLKAEPEIDPSRIGIFTDHGIVTLTGLVRSYPEKVKAEMVTRGVHGVKAVGNDIDVRLAGTRRDSEVIEDIIAAMKLDVNVPVAHIAIKVSSGFVILGGTVDWNYQRIAAQAAAACVAGVRDVHNCITIKPKTVCLGVEQKLEAALRRIAGIDPRQTSIEANNGEINLYGNVPSAYQKEEINQTAWSTPGVCKVCDHINVVP